MTTVATIRSVYPCLRYADTRAAIDFLVRAFGFTVKVVHESQTGGVAHAELFFDNGLVMLGDRPADRPAPPAQSRDYVVYVAVDDVDAHHAAAVAAGATVTRPPQDQPYGSREYDALDPEGNIWSFGTYRP